MASFLERVTFQTHTPGAGSGYINREGRSINRGTHPSFEARKLTTRKTPKSYLKITTHLTIPSNKRLPSIISLPIHSGNTHQQCTTPAAAAVLATNSQPTAQTASATGLQWRNTAQSVVSQCTCTSIRMRKPGSRFVSLGELPFLGLLPGMPREGSWDWDVYRIALLTMVWAVCEKDWEDGSLPGRLF
jgi:hypothetical protein